MKKLVLCAGHYLGTEDRRCLKKYDPNETREWELNSRVVDRVMNLLLGYNIEILRVDDPTGKTYISVDDRVEAGNDFGADFWLGVHHNAGINGGSGGGISVYVERNADSESLAWQRDLYNALVKYEPELIGNRATPMAKSDLKEVKNTKMPAVLLELGFMDAPSDIPIIITYEHAEKCARAITDVIISRFNLVEDDDPTYYTGEPKPVYVGGALYVNGPDRTVVYSDSALTQKVGSLDPNETANLLYIKGDLGVVLYSVTNTTTKKVGFIKL